MIVRAQSSSLPELGEEKTSDRSSIQAPAVSLPVSNPKSIQNSDSGTPSAAGSVSDSAMIQSEVGERDRTYLRTRVVFRYDYKVQDGPTESNRFQLKLLYGFGSHQRLGISVNLPVVHNQTEANSASGLGDADLAFGGNIYYTERLRLGLSGQVTFQSASDQLLGGASTKLKGSWGFSYVVNRRFQVTTAFNYKQSIHITRGSPTKQFETDITLNTRLLKATWFLESDSYYDFIPARYAPMLKPGLARSFGKRKSWNVSAYTQFPLNGYARQTQNHADIGLDLTWYPFPGR